MRNAVLLFLLPIIVFVTACTRTKVNPGADDLQVRFNKGLKYFAKKKYYRAQEEFEYVLLRGRHTELADSAQFYLAESYFFNKEYLLALNEYDQLVRYMTYSPFVELGRYRICQCYEKKSPKYFLDQEYTQKAIERYQEFIEDYPDSGYREPAAQAIVSLRTKLAKKEYESAVLYIKMEEYKAALNYLKELLVTYYDTEYADLTRLKIVEVHLKQGDMAAAEEFLQENEPKFKDERILEDARLLVSESKAKLSPKGKS